MRHFCNSSEVSLTRFRFSRLCRLHFFLTQGTHALRCKLESLKGPLQTKYNISFSLILLSEQNDLRYARLISEYYHYISIIICSSHLSPKTNKEITLAFLHDSIGNHALRRSTTKLRSFDTIRAEISEDESFDLPSERTGIAVNFYASYRMAGRLALHVRNASHRIAAASCTSGRTFHKHEQKGRNAPALNLLLLHARLRRVNGRKFRENLQLRAFVQCG